MKNRAFAFCFILFCSTGFTQEESPDEPETEELTTEDVEEEVEREDAGLPREDIRGENDKAELETGSKSIIPEFYGRLQLKHEYANIAKGNATETSEVSVRRVRLGGKGEFFDNAFYNISLKWSPWDKYPGLRKAYLKYKFQEDLELVMGLFKKSFSQARTIKLDSISSTERSFLYLDLLEDQNGYAGYDVGLEFRGMLWNTFGYDLGLFHGLVRESGYNPPDAETHFKYPIKDGSLHLTARVNEWLGLEAGYLVKSVPPDSGNIMDSHINMIYQLGMHTSYKNTLFRSELSYGDNHMGLNQNIISGSRPFVAYQWVLEQRLVRHQKKYLTAVLMGEGVDPAISDRVEYTNDALSLYYAGIKIGLNKWYLSLGLYQLNKITEAQSSSDKRSHHLEILLNTGF